MQKLRWIRCAAAALLALLSAPPAGAAQMPSTPPPRDGRQDFDFEIGLWNTRLKRLAQPLSGAQEWLEYQGTTTVTRCSMAAPTWSSCR